MTRRICVRWLISLILSLTCFGGPLGNPFPRIAEIHLNDLLNAHGLPSIEHMSVSAARPTVMKTLFHRTSCTIQDGTEGGRFQDSCGT
jgi:hypothetical protein